MSRFQRLVHVSWPIPGAALRLPLAVTFRAFSAHVPQMSKKEYEKTENRKIAGLTPVLLQDACRTLDEIATSTTLLRAITDFIVDRRG